MLHIYKNYKAELYLGTPNLYINLEVLEKMNKGVKEMHCFLVKVKQNLF